jgi:hypothetical protein
MMKEKNKEQKSRVKSKKLVLIAPLSLSLLIAVAARSASSVCQLTFPPGQPLAEINWHPVAVAGRKTDIVNGKDRALASGKISIPADADLIVTLKYSGLEGIAAIDQLAKCRVVNFSAAKLDFSDEHMKHIAGFKHLTTLNVDDTLVSDASLDEIGRFSALSALRLSITDISGKHFDALKNLKQLGTLQLSGCALQKGFLAGLKPLYGNLHDINFSSVNFSKEDAVSLSQMQAVKTLNLSKNKQVDDSFVPYIAKLKNLTFLNIADTGITDASLKELSSAPSLTRVVIRPAQYFKKRAPQKVAGKITFIDIAEKGNTTQDMFSRLH